MGYSGKEERKGERRKEGKKGGAKVVGRMGGGRGKSQTRYHINEEYISFSHLKDILVWDTVCICPTGYINEEIHFFVSPEGRTGVGRSSRLTGTTSPADGRDPTRAVSPRLSARRTPRRRCDSAAPDCRTGGLGYSANRRKTTVCWVSVTGFRK